MKVDAIMHAFKIFRMQYLPCFHANIRRSFAEVLVDVLPLLMLFCTSVDVQGDEYPCLRYENY